MKGEGERIRKEEGKKIRRSEVRRQM